MASWQIDALLLGGGLVLAAALAYALNRWSDRHAGRKALASFPDDDDEEQRATYHLLRFLESPVPRLFRWSNVYRGHAKRRKERE